MKNNNLNKEERLLQDKLNDLNFEFNEGKWQEFESRLNANKSTIPSFKWLKVATIMLILTASAYIALLDYTEEQENSSSETEFVQDKKKSTPAVTDSKETNPKDETDEEILMEEEYEIEYFEDEVYLSSEDTLSIDITDKSAIEVASETFDEKDADEEDSNINELKQLEINMPEQLCLYSTINFTVKQRSAFKELQWKIDGERFSGEYKFFEPGIYTITATAKNEDQLFKDTLTLHFEEPLKWDFTYEQMEGIFSDFTVRFKTDANVPLTWNIENEEIVSQQPIYTFQEEGLYDVTAFSKDEQGCITEVYKPIAVLKDFELYAAEVFTPNGDGINDVFLPPALESIDHNYTLIIYNIRGKEVFSSTEKAVGWNGKLHNSGTLLPKGNYVWKVIVRNGEGTERMFTGSIKIVEFEN